MTDLKQCVHEGSITKIISAYFQLSTIITSPSFRPPFLYYIAQTDTISLSVLKDFARDNIKYIICLTNLRFVFNLCVTNRHLGLPIFTHRENNYPKRIKMTSRGQRKKMTNILYATESDSGVSWWWNRIINNAKS